MLDFSIERRFDLPGNIKAMFLERGPRRIELFQVPAPKPLPDERRDPRRDLETLGNKHLSFQTRHYDRLRKRLEDHDVRIILDIGESDEKDRASALCSASSRYVLFTIALLTRRPSISRALIMSRLRMNTWS